MRLTIGILLILLPLTRGSAGEVSHAVRLNLYAAEANFSRAQYAEAAKICVTVLQHDPENTEAYVKLGSAYFAMGMLDLALFNWKEGIRIAPDLRASKEAAAFLAAKADSLMQEGVRAYLEGDYTLAARRFQEVLQIDPGRQDAQEYQDSAAAKGGTSASSVSRGGTASAIRQEAIDRRKSEAEHAKLSAEWERLRQEQDRFKKRQHPSETKKAEVNNEAARPDEKAGRSARKVKRLYTRGLAARASDDLQKAKRLFQDALKLDPDHVLSRKALDVVLREESQ